MVKDIAGRELKVYMVTTYQGIDRFRAPGEVNLFYSLMDAIDLVRKLVPDNSPSRTDVEASLDEHGFYHIRPDDNSFTVELEEKEIQ